MKRLPFRRVFHASLSDFGHTGFPFRVFLMAEGREKVSGRGETVDNGAWLLYVSSHVKGSNWVLETRVTSTAWLRPGVTIKL